MDFLARADAAFSVLLHSRPATFAVPSDQVCENLSAFSKHHLASPRRAKVHRLIMLSAEQRAAQTGVRFERHAGRLASLANTSRIFHMTHIAKTGGRSVRAELLKIVRVVGGAEQCLAPFVHESRVNVVFLREPRGHVLSQYLHGAYAGRATARRSKGFPVVDGDDYFVGFARWIDHFARDWTPSKGDFGGYNPMNMMARTLTCTDEHWNCDFIQRCDVACAHHVGNDPKDATPPLTEALAAVHTVDVLGVVELLHEVLCVVEFRVKGALSPGCTCMPDGSVRVARGGGINFRGRAHIVNSRGQRVGRKVSASEIPAHLIRSLDSIISVDISVYRAAVIRVLCDLRALELTTGAQVLCNGRLELLQNQTSYIPELWPATAL